MNCPNCGAPKPKRWRRCEYCTGRPRKFRRGENPDRVALFKTRVLALKETARAAAQRDAAFDHAERARERQSEAEAKLDHAQRELGRLLDHWVGWPPQERAVRALPPSLRIAIMPRLRAVDLIPPSVQAPVTEVSFQERELFELRAWIESAEPVYPMHHRLRVMADGRPPLHVAYYLDQSARVDTYYALQHMLHQLQHERSKR